MAFIQQKAPALSIKAGHQAIAHIKAHGLQAQDVDIIPGAAGGPKGIGLCGLDQAIFSEFLAQHSKKRWLIGSSIGSWRFAAIAAHGGMDGPSKLAELYTDMDFYKGMPMAEVSQRCKQTLTDLISGKEQQIIQHQDYQLAILAVRSKHLLSSDHALPLMAALFGVFSTNMVHRRALNLFMQRGVAYQNAHLQHLPIHAQSHFKSEHIPLNTNNLMDMLMASGAIPAVMQAVKNIADAPQGSYRDGGLIDYHLDLPFHTDGLVLYPHFTDKITPGWFDKSLTWRKANPQHHHKTILISPSAEYLKSLPLGRLPDRKDFISFAGRDRDRKKLWRQSIAESTRLGDEFLELLQGNKIVDHLQPL
jgi:hypothetical protein